MSEVRGLGTDLTLEVGGKKLERAILQTIVATGLTLTTQGSSTITMTTKDPEHLLVHSGWFSSKAEAFLDGLSFKACAFKKKVDEFTLEFEDRDFWLMKEGPRARDPVKVFRGHKTLQEFVKEQTKKFCPHTNFVCPQLKEDQPREPANTTSTTEGEKGAPVPGLTAGEFKIENEVADAEQAKMATILLNACIGTPAVVAVAIICAAIGESTLRNLTTPNSAGYWGVLQGGSGASGSQPNFPKTPSDQTAKEMAECFVKGGRGFGNGPKANGKGAAALARGGMTDPGEIATEVEDSGEAPSYYGKHKAEAEEIIKAYGGSPSSFTSKTTTTVTPEFFELNQKVNTNEEPEEEDENEENALSGIEAFLKPGKWLLWKYGNTFYLYSEKYLQKCKAVAKLSENSKGILDIGYELDHSKKKVSKVIIECRALLWEVPPGQLVSFDDSVGEAISRDDDGKVRKWIVYNIERKDITDNATTIELILPTQAKKEKAESKKELTVIAHNPATGNHESQTDPTGTKLRPDSLIWQVYVQGKWIDEQRYIYFEGGGHATFHATPVPGLFKGESRPKKSEEEGLDCSGLLSWDLHSAGLWPTSPAGKTTGRTNKEEISMEVAQGTDSTPFDTHEFEEVWGEPGEGKYITVWVKNSGGVEHCFMWIQIPGSMRPEGGPDIDVALEASRPGGSPEVGFRPRLAAYPNPAAEGFKARHWKGT